MQKEKGTTEDEMVGWHHRLDGHEFEQALGVGEEQGCLAWCSPWGYKESDMTELLYLTETGSLTHVCVRHDRASLQRAALFSLSGKSSPFSASFLPPILGKFPLQGKHT